MAVIDIGELFPEELELVTLVRDEIFAPPSSDPPNDGPATALLAQNSLHRNSPPLQGRNFIATELIVEAEVTTPEDIRAQITAIMATVRDMSDNQAKHWLQSMADLIFLMVVDEKYTRVQILHSIIDFFSAVG